MRISSIKYYLFKKDLAVRFLSLFTDNLHLFHSFVVEQVAVGIHAVDIDGKTVIYNEKMKEIEGLDFADLKDRTIVELFNFEQQESTLLKVLQSKKTLLNVKQTYWNRNGIEITTINDTYPIFLKNELIGAVELARDITTFEKMMQQPVRHHHEPANFSQLTAASNAMKTVISTAQKAATAKLPVLLIGEPGTGKDILAQCIHSALEPRNTHFYTLNCQSSDAVSLSKLQEAVVDNSSFTLFCERIDLLPIPLQQKLLTILQNLDRQNMQLIASIGVDPIELITNGTLLKELYYFFTSFAITIPPLRKRKTDIKPFVLAYLATRNQLYPNTLQSIAPDVEKLFKAYDWPGNVRELEILLDEVASVVTTETTITYDMLPLHFRVKNDIATNNATQASHFIVQKEKDLLPLDQYLKEAEAYYVEKALDLYDNNVTKTAKALGMSRQSLQYRIKKLKEEK